jgi:hypothetical protein
MKNKLLTFHCKRCRSKVSKWTRLPPNEVHTYRITCSRCHLFIGWGTESQFQQLLDARRPLVADVEAPGATLEDWF